MSNKSKPAVHQVDERPQNAAAPLAGSGTAVDQARLNWVMLIYLCSGLCSLIDEVVWVRLLKLILGNTVYASTIVVSMFMGGLAAGALVMSRFADRVRHPMRLYAVLEVGATFSALALPWMLQLADSVYRWFYAVYRPSTTGLLFLQIITSATILLVPAMVMGSTLPLLGRYVTQVGGGIGRYVGRLYALNTLGAATGCFLAGTVLIRSVGVMPTLYIAAALNLLVALGGYVLSRNQAPAVEPATTVPDHSNEQQIPGNHRLLLMLGFFGSGLISIGYEIIWMRSIVFRHGAFTYVFSSVLTVYLLGNFIGAWIGSRLSRRLERPAVAFGVSLGLLGILGLFYFRWLGQWHSSAADQVLAVFGQLASRPAFTKSFAPLIHSTFLYLIPAIMMGIGFPLALQAWSNLKHEVGETTGTVYGINTIGAVLGGISSGFVLLPLVGAQMSMSVLGLGAIWIGGAMVLTFSTRRTGTMQLGVVVVLLFLTVLGIVLPSETVTEQVVRIPNTELLDTKEGVTTTVSVHQVPVNNAAIKLLASSGLVVAGNDEDIRSGQQTLGHLGTFLNKNSREVLTVGFGSGETSACLSTHNLERLDCVEISPELVELALRHFGDINLGDDLNSEVNMMYMDGKNYLHLTDQHYDLIMNGANVPSQTGSAPMFAREHFINAREHLNPNGLFMTKMHLTSVSRSGFDSILGTFMDVFPHASIWFPVTKPHVFFYLVGSREPQTYSPQHIDNELARENVSNRLNILRYRNSHDVLSCYVGDETDLRRYVGEEYETNSDYTPYVEFNLDEDDLMKSSFFHEFIGSVRRDSLLKHIDWTGFSDAQREQWTAQHKIVYEVSTHIIEAQQRQDTVTPLQHIAAGLQLMPDHPALLDQKNRVLARVQSDLNRGKNDRFFTGKIIEDMNAVLVTAPDFSSAWRISSQALQFRQDWPNAVAAGEKAVETDPENAFTRLNLGMLLQRTGNTEQAMVHLLEAVRLQPDNAGLRRALASVYNMTGQRDKAIGEFREAIRLAPDDRISKSALQKLLGESR